MGFGEGAEKNFWETRGRPVKMITPKRRSEKKAE